jgi:hypothetical protein
MASIKGRWKWVRASSGAGVKHEGPAPPVRAIERVGFASLLEGQYGSGDGPARAG